MDRHLILIAKEGFTAQEVLEHINTFAGFPTVAEQTKTWATIETSVDGVEYLVSPSNDTKCVGWEKALPDCYEELELPEEWVPVIEEPVYVASKEVIVKKVAPVVEMLKEKYVPEPIVEPIEANPSKVMNKLVFLLKPETEKAMAGTIPYDGKCVQMHVVSSAYDPKEHEVLGLWEWVGDEMVELIELDRKGWLNYLPDTNEHDKDMKITATQKPTFKIPCKVAGWPEII